MNGKQHKIANIYAGGVMVTTTQLVFQNIDLTIAAVIGSTVGTVVTPDLDLVVPSNFFSKLPIINFFWMCMWWPYKKLVRHRSWVSHSPLVSTILRLLYMWFYFSLFLFAFGGDFNYVYSGIWLNIEFYMMLFFCWVVQDLVHLWLDFVL